MATTHAAGTRSTVVGVFTDRAQAQQCVNELRKAGFREDQIGVAGRDGDATGTGAGATATAAADKTSHIAAGAATGVAAGAGAGALWALGIAAGFLPAIGPVIAGGILASVLASAAGGAAVAGLVGALVGLGIPEEEAKYYESEFHAGRIVVTVRAESRYDEAQAIVNRYGAYNMHTRGTAAAAAPVAAHATHAAASHTHAAGGAKVQLHEEQLHAHKDTVQTGDVKVRKEVHTEHKTITVPVEREEVVIERRAVGGHATAGEIKAEEIRIPVKEERVHVTKDTIVKEEVTVGKRKVQGTETVGGTVRSEELKVEETGNVEVRGDVKGTTHKK